MKRISTLLCAVFTIFLSQTAASSGLLFNVNATGTPANLSITLCLNGNGPLSCQNHTVSALNLSINTTIPNHAYPAIGIKVNTPDYVLAGYTPIANGYCLFSANNTTPASITVSSTSGFSITAITGGNGTISPSGSVVVNEGGSQTFTATPNADYAVSQWLLDGSLVQTGGNTYTLSNVTANHAVEVTFGQATLTPSVASLALSVNCQTAGGSCAYSNAALTGHPRQITITNHGSVPATNVSVVATGFPSLTTISSSTCGSTLNAGTPCTITITPGQVATSTCTSGTAPSNGTVTVSSNDAPPSVINVVVLSYGCQYQSGYLYSVDDSYTGHPESNSIGGKVAALSDNDTGIYWDSSSGCITTPFNGCYTTNADSGIDGSNVQTPSGNTYLIYQVLTITNPPAESASSYAAGLCTAYTAGGYTDWYLPAICEMGYGGSDLPYFNCGTQSSPALQNMQSNLSENNIASLSQYYWSSTEYVEQTSGAWDQYFADGSSSSNVDSKSSQFGVRCSRALTL